MIERQAVAEKLLVLCYTEMFFYDNLQFFQSPIIFRVQSLERISGSVQANHILWPNNANYIEGRGEVKHDHLKAPNVQGQKLGLS